MKMKNIFILILLLIGFNSYFANTCELWFHIKNSAGQSYGYSLDVSLYKVLAGNSISNMVLKKIGDSHTTASVSYGISLEMINNESNGYCNSPTFNEILGADGSQYYCLVFRGVDIFFFYVGDVNGYTAGDDTYIYQVDSNGVWTFARSVDECHRIPSTNAQYSYSGWNPITLTVSNDFYGGDMIVDNVTINLSSSSNTFYTTTNSMHSIQAFSQSYGGYYHRFKYWNTNQQDVDSSKTFTISSNISHVANFYHYSSLDLYTSFEGTVQNGYFLIDGLTINTNTNVSKRSDVNLEFESQNQEKNNLIYTFDNWKKNGNVISTSSIYTFKPEVNATYTLNLKPLKPSNTYRNLQFRNPDNSSPTTGSNIRINWNTHPDNRVDAYQIWRKVKHNGVVGSPQLLSTLSSSSTYFIDYNYVYTDGYTDDILYYDVRARLYYNSNYTYADSLFEAVYEVENTKFNSDDLSQNITNGEIPEIYSVNNYPNPFNPTTTINYQIPEAGFVTLKVYDILGKEVVTLVNENKQAGYHSALFTINSSLSSGIYIYTFQCNGYKQSRKMLLTK